MGTAEAARAIEPLCMLWCVFGFLRSDWVHAFKLLTYRPPAPAACNSPAPPNSISQPMALSLELVQQLGLVSPLRRRERCTTDQYPNSYYYQYSYNALQTFIDMLINIL
jgi:hypothetical protein